MYFILATKEVSFIKGSEKSLFFCTHMVELILRVGSCLISTVEMMQGSQ